MNARMLVIAGMFGAGLGLAAPHAVAQNKFDSWYTIALAASHNATDQVQSMLVQGGQDPDAVDSVSGRTALDYAASFNNLAMAKILLDHGAGVDARDPSGNTALHWAAERGNIAVMKLLIARKAMVDAADKQGITPLMQAIAHSQPRAVRLLIESGADPHKQDFTGRDAFGWARENPTMMQALEAKR